MVIGGTTVPTAYEIASFYNCDEELLGFDGLGEEIVTPFKVLEWRLSECDAALVHWWSDTLLSGYPNGRQFSSITLYTRPGTESTFTNCFVHPPRWGRFNFSSYFDVAISITDIR